MLIHNSDSPVNFLIKLYSAVIPVDWDEIATFNSYPQINRNTAEWILSKAGEKYDRGELNMLWLNKGFSGFHEHLEDFHIGLPDNLYTLKPIYTDQSHRGVEEFFDENKHDEENGIKKNM